jgi:hypothetical protein
MEGISFISYRLLAYQYFRTSGKDIVPRFGQIFDLNLEHTPFENMQLGAIGSIRAGLYLPGPVKHHSFFVSLTAQKQFIGDNQWVYHSIESLPRGYSGLISNSFNKLSLNYYFPIVYPDFTIGTLFYLKRIRGSLFMDLARGYGVRDYSGSQRIIHTRNFSSEGGELLADFHIFQLMFPFTGGIQGIYLPEEKRIRYYPVIRINLTSF